ncbi:hypothetical protein D3C83_275770 [compost metagenome]
MINKLGRTLAARLQGIAENDLELARFDEHAGRGDSPPGFTLNAGDRKDDVLP